MQSSPRSMPRPAQPAGVSWSLRTDDTLLCHRTDNKDSRGSCPPGRQRDCPPGGQRDCPCPVCLQTSNFPVRTNCGHQFCAPCLMSYWRHGSWLNAINCPLCRQKVRKLSHLFRESQTDRQERSVLKDLTEYNQRYSGAPRPVTEQLCDALLLSVLVLRGLSTMGCLVSLFILRVALCCAGSLLPPDPPGAPPSLLGLLDDLLVVLLLLTCLVNINQQMEPETRSAPRRR